MAEKAKASDLIISSEAKKHTVETPFGEMDVWIRDLSWVERQNALTKFVSLGTDDKGQMQPQIDFGGLLAIRSHDLC